MEEASELSQRILDYGLLVYKYYSPVLFVFGVMGNSLSILVFLLDPEYRRKSSSYYLTALAISDTGFLINLFAIWLGSLNNGVITSAFTCPLVMYRGQVTCFVTVYLTVAFSVERYIAIYFPLRKLQICTASNARKVICVIVATALILFVYAWFIAEVAEVETNGERRLICTVSNRYHKISERANYLDSLFTLVIPFFVVTFFNFKIAIKLCENGAKTASLNSVSIRLESLVGQEKVKKINLPKFRKRGRDIIKVIYVPIAFIDGVEIMRTGETKLESWSVKTTHVNHKPKLSERRVTKTLLLVSVVFLCLNLPLHVLRCAQFILERTPFYLDGIKFILALQPWAMMLFNTNFAVNFSLYCMSGRGFRTSLHRLLVRFLLKSLRTQKS